MSQTSCRECGSAIVDVRAVAVFCSSACRHAFNNRRSVRGAVLYDLWMALRYDRGAAKAYKIFTLMCALGQQYRQEDVERGGGHLRKSWLDPGAVLDAKPWLRLRLSADSTQRP